MSRAGMEGGAGDEAANYVRACATFSIQPDEDVTQALASREPCACDVSSKRIVRVLRSGCSKLVL